MAKTVDELKGVEVLPKSWLIKRPRRKVERLEVVRRIEMMVDCEWKEAEKQAANLGRSTQTLLNYSICRSTVELP
jgi:hypothetical protein